jgi:hypothetical protein
VAPPFLDKYFVITNDLSGEDFEKSVTDAYNSMLDYFSDINKEDNCFALLFMKKWQEGDWGWIQESCPDFDLNTAKPCGYRGE